MLVRKSLKLMEREAQEELLSVEMQTEDAPAVETMPVAPESGSGQALVPVTAPLTATADLAASLDAWTA
jgi:hypothetical protein